jgi:hypothetical protein
MLWQMLENGPTGDAEGSTVRLPEPSAGPTGANSNGGFTITHWPHPVFPRESSAFLAITRRINEVLAASCGELLSFALCEEIRRSPAGQRGHLFLEEEPVTAVIDRLTTHTWPDEICDEFVLRATANTISLLRQRIVKFDEDPADRVAASLLVRRLIQLAVSGIDPMDRTQVENAVLSKSHLPPAWGPPDPGRRHYRAMPIGTVLDFLRRYVDLISLRPWGLARRATSNGEPGQINKLNSRTRLFTPPRWGEAADPLPHKSLLQVEAPEGEPEPITPHVKRLLTNLATCQQALAPTSKFVPHALRLLRFAYQGPRLDDAQHLYVTAGVLAVVLGIPVRDILAFTIHEDDETVATLMPSGDAIILNLGGPYYEESFGRLPPQKVEIFLPEWIRSNVARAFQTIQETGRSSLGEAVRAGIRRTARGHPVVGALDALRPQLEAATSGAERYSERQPVHSILHLAWFYIAICIEHQPVAWVQLATGKPAGPWRSAMSYYSCAGEEFSKRIRSTHAQIHRLAGIPEAIPDYPPATRARIGQGTPTLKDIARQFSERRYRSAFLTEKCAMSSVLLDLVGRRPTHWQPHPATHVYRLGSAFLALLYDKNKGGGMKPRLVPMPPKLARAALGSLCPERR